MAEASESGYPKLDKNKPALPVDLQIGSHRDSDSNSNSNSSSGNGNSNVTQGKRQKQMEREREGYGLKILAEQSKESKSLKSIKSITATAKPSITPTGVERGERGATQFRKRSMENKLSNHLQVRTFKGIDGIIEK